MARDYFKALVLENLLQNDPNKDKHYEKMKYNLNDEKYIYNAPVNPAYFESLDSKHSVVLTSEVYETLEVIEDYTFRNKKEVPFILYGKESKGGAIIFDDIDCDFRKLKDNTASFENIDEYFMNTLTNTFIDDDKNRVFCAGHTHPFNGDRVVFNYSLSDLMLHLQLVSYEVFSDVSRNNKLFSLMKTITKDFNFIYYDINKGRFFKVEKVYLQTKKKEFIPLSAYEFCDD